MKWRMRKGMTKARRFFDRGEEGFAIVVVLVALLMLSVLGAASLLLMVSSLEGMANAKPEDKAFQIAESAIYVAHAKIVNDEVEADVPVSGSLLGGDYQFVIDPIEGSYDYLVTAEGSYVKEGITYRRKIEEQVTYSGMQAFDTMRNYLLFAGNDINIDINEFINAGAPITFNGDIRAEHNVNIQNRPDLSLGDGLTINGSVEAKNRVYVRCAPQWFGAVNTRIYGDILTGDIATNTKGTVQLWVDGQASIFPPKLSLGYIYAATTGGSNWDIYANQPMTLSVNTLFGWPLGAIYTGTTHNAPGCETIYTPEPNMEYYRALAEDQGNFTEGNRTLSGNLGTYSLSSVTVIYCTGNLTLNGLAWNQPDMKGIFVCEGNFTANSTLQFNDSSDFQVIAGGNVTFNNDWSFLGAGSSNEYFFWAGNDAFIDLGMFSEQRLQVTAKHDINVFSSENLFALCTVNYSAPDVDVAGFPIDLSIKNWKELPSE